MPLTGVSVVTREQPGVGRHRHTARLSRLQLDPLEAKQAYALVACRLSQIELRDISAVAVAGIRDGEGRRDGLAAADFEIAVVEARVVEAVAEGVERSRPGLRTSDSRPRRPRRTGWWWECPHRIYPRAATACPGPRDPGGESARGSPGR